MSEYPGAEQRLKEYHDTEDLIGKLEQLSDDLKRNYEYYEEAPGVTSEMMDEWKEASQSADRVVAFLKERLKEMDRQSGDC